MAFEMSWKRFWLPLLAIAINVGVLWFTNRSVTPLEPSWKDVVVALKPPAIGPACKHGRTLAFGGRGGSVSMQCSDKPENQTGR